MAVRAPRGSLARGRRRRDPRERVLIVTEGQKTEPLYLEDLVAHYRINAAAVTVVPSTRGSDPLSVVDVALKTDRHERRLGEQYDRVYCVFDRDSHANFDAASDKAKAKGLLPARSWPCFEFWLLLHYRYTRHPYESSDGRSPCDNCIHDLRQHMGDYDKGQAGLFDLLKGRIEQAKTHARRAMEDAKEVNQPNPSTEVHELVDYLQKLNA